MCGIFGAIPLDGRPRPALAESVAAGLRLIKHRGPDADAVDAGAVPCVLGQARLSILDLETGDQPMWDATRRGLITFNGEIYNFPEARRRLEAAGRRFATRSDTEVVLNAFLQWGPDGVRELRGMFAFAAVDLERRRALLARDRLGKKPLYTTTRDGVLYFSSEIEALYRTVGPFPMDPEALDEYLAWQYISAPRTIYHGVRALEPATLLDIDLATGTIAESRYWDLEWREDRSLSPEDWLRKLDALIEEAVRIRMVADVPYGAFLSGGVDSSLVVAYMARILDRPVKTFTIGFRESTHDETPYARQAAEANGTEHHVEIVEADSLGLLPTLVRHYGQPFADSSAIPTYYVSRMARRHVKMVLSGDGGDENFAGYNSYETVLRELAGRSAQPGTADGRRLLRLGAHFLGRIASARRRSLDALSWAYDRHCLTAYHFPPRERRALFLAPWRRLVADDFPDRRRWAGIGRNQPILSALQNVDIHAYLPFDILVKTDIASMANSLEVRVPLLDHLVVEAAASMPSELKLKIERGTDGTVRYDKKHILKTLAGKYYDPGFIDRPKMGFGIPLGAWFAGKLRPAVEKKLLGSEFLDRYFDRAEIAALLARHTAEQDYSTRIWNLLFLEEWMRTHPEAL